MKSRIRVIPLIVILFILMQFQSVPLGFSTTAGVSDTSIALEIADHFDCNDLATYQEACVTSFTSEIILAFQLNYAVLIMHIQGSSLIFIIGHSRVDDNENYVDPYSKITELQDFKFLLNPTRLAIIKILQDYSQITSSELRSILTVSWGVLRQNLQALEKNGYIQIDYKFIDEKAFNVISINSIAIQEYSKLGIILNNLFD
ncbi:MAG: helix-turn-helix transcriptional regulator [Candidatus Heimdallarchaeota archaeon]|nr:helix-turn-helix transcriptional regulator [Candidatus Heimdallarchaeota archaeon]